MGLGMTGGRIAITGATGFIGQRLVAALAAAPEPPGVTVLTRDAEAARRLFPPPRFPGLSVHAYDPLDRASIASALAGAEAVIHLAGAPIATRWTPAARAAIRSSRIEGTRALVEAIVSMRERPGLLISPSACRYYGTSETARLDETSPPGPAGDFLGDICRGWEAEAAAAADHGLRVVILRTGIVLGLTAEGRRMIERMRRFLGGRIGSGRQWVSWIHRDDVVRILLRALADPAMAGVYNATAPTPARMLQVTDAFARVMGSYIRVPIPGAVLGEVLGDAATVILEGQRVHPDRLLAEGFAFRFPTIGPAVHDILTSPGDRPVAD
jgi:uncharacterized protein (TIGR01777 family)